MDCATKFVVGEAPESDDEEGYYKVDVVSILLTYLILLYKEPSGMNLTRCLSSI